MTEFSERFALKVMATVIETGQQCILSKRQGRVFGDRNGKPEHHKLSHERETEPQISIISFKKLKYFLA